MDDVENQMNQLLMSAITAEYCEGCPNLTRVKINSQNGVYPRWGAGNISAPIILILERPGNQLYLSELGKTTDEMASSMENVKRFRQNYTEIMYAGYEDGLRLLEGILEFLYAKQARNLLLEERLKLLQKLVFITELVKCPGEPKNGGRVLKHCPNSFLRREWDIISNKYQLPFLVIIAGRKVHYFPSNFPKQVKSMLVNSSFSEEGITYLNIYHPSRAKQFLNPESILKIEETAEKYRIPLQTDLGKKLNLFNTVYLLTYLDLLPNKEELKMRIISKLQSNFPSF